MLLSKLQSELEIQAASLYDNLNILYHFFRLFFYRTSEAYIPNL